jgi:hypothetical protein
MNTGITAGDNMCVGALSFSGEGGSFGWAFGGTFLVSLSSRRVAAAGGGDVSDACLQKNVYSVFRESPPSIGFAQLSTLAATSPTA